MLLRPGERPAAHTHRHITWDVDGTELSHDGSMLAFTTNENGTAKAYILTTATGSYVPVRNLPVGI